MNKIYIEEKKSNDHNNMSDSNFQRNPESEKVFGKFNSAKDLARLKSEEFKRILSKYWVYILIGILLLITLYIFLMYWPGLRIPRLLRYLNVYKDYVNLQSCSLCADYLSTPGNDGYQNNVDANGGVTQSGCEGVYLPYRLCDFYVSSSYKSYLIGWQKKDYVSEEAITKLIKGGCRFIDLDIFDNGFQCKESETFPIVTNGRQEGKYNYMFNYIKFEDCCKAIATCAFSANCVGNFNDPFFLNLRINTTNKTTINKVAKIYYNYFKYKMLSKRYSYQRVNIGRAPISELFGKIILLCDKNFKGTQLNELTNYSPSLPFLRKYNNKDFETGAPSFDTKMTTNFNRRNLTMIYPLGDDRVPVNYNPQIAWYYGCQFVCLNWQIIDDDMATYINKFKNHSFILKPCALRYKPPLYTKPDEQNPALYFNTLNINTPFYSTNI